MLNGWMGVIQAIDLSIILKRIMALYMQPVFLRRYVEPVAAMWPNLMDLLGKR